MEDWLAGIEMKLELVDGLRLKCCEVFRWGWCRCSIIYRKTRAVYLPVALRMEAEK